MIANVAKVGGTEQSVAEGVDEHVGITMSQEPQRVGYLHTAYDEFAAFDKAVNVEAKTYSVHEK